MDLRQLTYFVAVAEEGQFTGAARRILVAQPAVSAQIRRLEEELGERLFQRDRPAVRLTAAGEALLPHARAALAAAARGREAISSLQGLLSGRLEVGVAGPVDPRLARALGRFHRTYPDVAVAFRQHLRGPLLEAVARGAVDVAVLSAGTEVADPPVRTSIVSTEPMVIAVGPDHGLAGRTRITLAALRDEPLITLTRESGLRRLLEDACREAGFTPQITAEAGDLLSLVELVAAGLGAALLPRSAASGGRVAVLELTRPRLERDSALAWNEAMVSPAARAFLELARDEFAAA